jgi:hypothetical protein
MESSLNMNMGLARLARGGTAFNCKKLQAMRSAKNLHELIKLTKLTVEPLRACIHDLRVHEGGS